MSDSALKLSHIFEEAGTAFSKLSELTRQLQYINDNQSGCKLNEEEIDMLRACVHRFAIDLNKLSLHIKNKTINQIKRTLKKKAFEDAGIPFQEESDQLPQQEEQPQTPQPQSPQPSQPPPPSTPTVLATNPEVTLNMLNATEAEPEEADGMDLEFDLLATQHESSCSSISAKEDLAEF